MTVFLALDCLQLKPVLYCSFIQLFLSPSSGKPQDWHLHMQVKRGAAAAESSDEEEDYQELPSNLASDAHSDGSEADSDSQDGPDGVKDAAVVDEGVSDLDYLKSRMRVGVRGADKETSSQTSSLTDARQGVHD